ncbi:MAG: pilin [Enterovibrio sp.]
MHKKSGFSLIELMIVVAIIGILSAIALPAYQNYIKKAELGTALATLNALKVNVEEYVSRTGTFPSSSELTDLGTASDAFKLGAISMTPVTDGDGAGSLSVAFDEGDNSTSVFKSTGATLTLARSSDALWTCSISVGGITAADDVGELSTIAPKGCTPVAAP